MNIGLYQVDGITYQGVPFPNLALMSVSAYHKNKGHQVSWYKGIDYANEYDLIYASKIFNFSEMPVVPPNMMLGGTGIDFSNTLPDHIRTTDIDWSIYPQVPYHAGFAMKGCRFKCSFCCVPQKEGRPAVHNSIDELLINPNGGNRLMLLDNDYFGVPTWKENLERIIELKLKVCFVQGLNIRILSEKQAELLAQCKYYNSKFDQRYLTFAWDQYDDRRVIMRGIKRCNDAGIPSNKIQFFILIGYDTTPEQDQDRVETLRDLGCMPFVMPYNKKDEYQKAYARYVNFRAVFKSCTWKEYRYNPDNVWYRWVYGIK